MFNKNPLQEEVKKAERAEGYFIMITRRNGETLSHVSFTKNFKTDDLIPSIENHREKAMKELNQSK